jgi:hypothetical protein
MGNEKHEKEDRELPFVKLFGLKSKTANGDADRKNEWQKHSPMQLAGVRHLALATTPETSNFQSPGIKPGIFFESQFPEWYRPGTPPIITQADEENCLDEFHDSDSEDVYDLYNACNGVLRNGLLDVRELDKLSLEELEVLDVARLREIWLHTASGCPTCAGIIRTLNAVRGTLSDDQEDYPG